MMKPELLDKIWGVVTSSTRVHPLVSSIIRMTQHGLRASASSLLLLDEENQELCFKFTNGSAGVQLKRLKINPQSGIAGRVVSSGKPLIVNNAKKSPYFSSLIDEVNGFEAKSIISAPLMTHARAFGVIEVINKTDGADFSQQDLQALIRVSTTAALAIENLRLNERLLDAYKNTVRALVSLADAKETCGMGHSRRVAAYALMGAEALSLPDKEKQDIEYAAILHDIGKLGIPDSVLNKSEALTKQEWEMIRKHPLIGSSLLRGIPFLREASQIILHHHERYDGQGYPEGLKGEAIPLGSRLLAVADAFDHMTTEHSYRQAIAKNHAFAELKKCVPEQFCPVAVKAFCSGFVKTHLLRNRPDR